MWWIFYVMMKVFEVGDDIVIIQWRHFVRKILIALRTGEIEMAASTAVSFAGVPAYAGGRLLQVLTLSRSVH